MKVKKNVEHSTIFNSIQSEKYNHVLLKNSNSWTKSTNNMFLFIFAMKLLLEDYGLSYNTKLSDKAKEFIKNYQEASHDKMKELA